MHAFSWSHWLSFFFIYCFFGWVFESTYVSIRAHHLVNRGFLHGPWIPIYGCGAIMMLFVSLPVRDSLPLVFLSGCIGATLLEYGTGFAMYRLFKVKWWDYSDQKFNLNGYICLSSTITWGFLTIILTEVFQPFLSTFVSGISESVDQILVLVLSVLFVSDLVSSIQAAWNIRLKVLALSRIRKELDELRGELERKQQEFHERAEAARESMAVRNEEAILAFTQKTDAIRERMAELQKKRESVALRMDWWTRSMLHNNPSASSHLEGFSDLKEILIRAKEKARKNWEL